MLTSKGTADQCNVMVGMFFEKQCWETVPMPQCIMGSDHIGTPSEQNNRQTPVKALPSCNCGNKYCESFIRWLLDTSRHEDMLVHKSDILAFPLPVSAKKSNGFDYSR